MALLRFGMAFVPRGATSIIMQQLNGPAHAIRSFYAFADGKDGDADRGDSEGDVEPEVNADVEELDSAEVDGTEAEAADGTEEEAPQTPDQVIEELNAKVQEHHDALLRGLAEQENVRRIAKMDVDKARTYAVQSFAKNLLEVADNLERARTSVPEEVPDADAPQFLTSLLEGVAMTDTGLHKVLESSGVTKFGAVGDKFDPHIHEAMFQYQDQNLEPGTVGSIIAPGYYLKDRVLRPAKVGTVKEPEPQNASAN